tara:strand:- start:1180 stop:1674 length:495 start_codon:yes stop_codon:yes gene_type:complete
MAHFAKISETNEVLAVHVVNNSDILNADGVEDETVGQTYLQQTGNWPATLWIQTSYNTIFNTHSSGDNSKAFRGNYAGVGDNWDTVNQIFWSPQPYLSWIKNISTANWDSPIGDAPNLTEEQITQKAEGTHDWRYSWNETSYQIDLLNNNINSSTGWVLENQAV